MTLGDIGIIIALITGAAGLLTAVATKKKLHADAAESISDAALSLIEPLKKRLAEAEAEIENNRVKLHQMEIELAVLKHENIEMSEGIAKLKYQVMSLGHKPIYEGIQ